MDHLHPTTYHSAGKDGEVKNQYRLFRGWTTKVFGLMMKMMMTMLIPKGTWNQSNPMMTSLQFFLPKVITLSQRLLPALLRLRTRLLLRDLRRLRSSCSSSISSTYCIAPLAHWEVETPTITNTKTLFNILIPHTVYHTDYPHNNLCNIFMPVVVVERDVDLDRREDNSPTEVLLLFME
jgi:hypothetical protein